ncbi:phage portal protein, partial [Pseudoalteromonas sp. S979]
MKPRLQVSNGHAPNYNQRTAVTDSFSFGDPEPSLDNLITHYVGLFSDSNGIYAPRISLQG